MILDYYFRRPVLWDFITSLVISLISFLLLKRDIFVLPKVEESYDLTGDVTNISFTMGGFILTILTLLITFKDNNSSITKEEKKTNFRIFFDTDFYYQSVKHLQNCIKEIIFIAALGFLIKLFSPESFRIYFFYYNIWGIFITILSVGRCLLILSNILKLQK